MTPISVQDLPTIDTEVLIVGAGPSGLMAGLVLARRGVPTLVIDKKPGPTQESRAVAVQARTMEIYSQLGIAQQVFNGGNPASRMQMGQGNDLLGFSVESTQVGSTDFPGIQIFEQSRNEELLSATLRTEGGSVRWRNRLVAVLRAGANDVDGFEALVEGPDGLFRVRSTWCIGSDGSQSMIRREMGASFDGVTNGATFFVADLTGISGLPDNTIATRFGDDSFAVLLPLGPGGNGRVISMVASESVDQDTALGRARSDLGMSYSAVDWFSSYRVHHRVASQFRKGQMFLAGDSGHVHSPVGGQGMNTGLQDAHNLANLLADVSQGRRSADALDQYEHERRPVALKLVQVTDRVFGVIARRGKGIAFLRRRIGAIMSAVAPRILKGSLGARVGGLLGQYRIRYRFSPEGSPAPVWAEDSVVGLRLPRVENNLESLRSLTWQLHGYGLDPVTPPRVPQWIEGPLHFGRDSRGQMSTDRLYLIRPDGYIAASLPTERGIVSQTVLSSALRAHHIVQEGPTIEPDTPSDGRK